ncbi:hypothetical protein [Pararhizobium sp. DWP3-4]|uniref:hypothetical protein n=1 Tax=Pararhizobium sp. DWP3-4 TaxID=2804565 RepID=UPI003CE75C11
MTNEFFSEGGIYQCNPLFGLPIYVKTYEATVVPDGWMYVSKLVEVVARAQNEKRAREQVSGPSFYFDSMGGEPAEAVNLRVYG